MYWLKNTEPLFFSDFQTPWRPSLNLQCSILESIQEKAIYKKERWISSILHSTSYSKSRMKSLLLFYTLGIFLIENNAAPYVHDEQERSTTVDPDLSGGPQMRKMDEGLGNLIHDLFNFVDILMDPQSYTNQHEVWVNTHCLKITQNVAFEFWHLVH